MCRGMSKVCEKGSYERNALGVDCSKRIVRVRVYGSVSILDYCFPCRSTMRAARAS